MVILGIDPGSVITGYSVIKRDEKKVFVADFGYLKMDPKKHISFRIETFYSFFEKKIQDFKITDLSLETPFLGKNAQTFLKLGYLRGILYLLATQNKLKIHEYSPRQIKLSIVGFGGATKEQVAMMIRKMFPDLDKLSKTVKNDVTDSLAVSICTVWNSRLNSYKSQVN